jgi:hypothetical protein
VIASIAKGLKRPVLRETLDAIHRYLAVNLRMVERSSYSHPSRCRRGRKTSVEILQGEAWGCSAHAQVACHLARACGIPAILVKSLTVDWVDWKNRGDGKGEGHVFVEVLDDKPALWDAEGGVLHEEYDSKAATTPDGKRYIYDKGSPDRLVLSHHGKQWEEETRRMFPAPRRR